MLGAKNYSEQPQTQRYKVRKLPENFMTSEPICEILSQLIDQINLSRETQRCVDEKYELLLSVIKDEMRDKLSPVSKSGRRKNTPYKPYWNDELSELWKIASSKESAYTRYRGPRRIKQTLRQAFLNARHNFDKLLRQRQRAYRRGLLIDIETCNTNDPRQFWNYIKKLGPSKSKSIPWEIYDSDGNLCTDREAVLNKWKDDYCNLLNENPGSYDNDFYDHTIKNKEHLERNMTDPLFVMNHSLNKPLDFSEIEKAINKAKVGKSAGIDGIPNEVLKTDQVMRCLHAFFQLCFDAGYIPSEWTQAIICPIPKSKDSDPRVPLNYRGLSILSCIYKVYSAVLNNRVLQFFEDNNLLHDEQNGFRSKRSCNDHIFSLYSLIKNSLNDKKEIYTCFVDFRKAFDMVPRDLLLYRLLEMGIDGKMYSAIKSIYRKASCSVRLNGSMSEWFDTNQGLKQGDNFSPTGFAAYLNPLISELKAAGIGVKMGDINVCVLAYADDIVLCAENELDLQRLVDILCQWCSKWRLSINTGKTKVMHFRKKTRDITKFMFHVNDSPLEIVSDYKYLGVLFNEHLDFSKTAELLANAGGRALGAVINKVKSNKDLGYKTFTTLIDSCVMPLLLYASGIWGQSKFKCCENVILRACRFYIGVHRLTPIPGIQGDCGWLDFKSRCNLESVRLYNRFVTMDAGRLNRAIFMSDKVKNTDNWNHKFGVMLNELDLTQYWNDSRIIPLDIVKEKIDDQFLANWRHNCSTKPKLRTYVTFKDNVEVASHIVCNLPKYERSLISQLRLGILPLRLETGRYSNLKECDRICLLCQQNMVENEEHFLFECDLYDTERNQFENEANINFAMLDTTEKFQKAFEHPYKLGRYMRVAMNKRKKISYIRFSRIGFI